MTKIEIKKDTPTKPLNKHWQFCVGSPHATYALRKDYYEQLKLVREELGIKRVRFHGIFGDDMHTLHSAADIIPMPGGKDYIEQSFRWCGAAYDNILAAGMQPFVELGFMPKKLAKRKTKGLFFYKPNISPPKNDEAWRDYIQSFIRFLIDRYGKDEVEKWFFEVWNEPDLRMPFFDGTKEDYFHLYEVTVKAIKDVDEKLMVGGPSTSGSKWVKELKDFCKNKALPLDFASTHQYAGDPLGGVDDSQKKEKLKLNVNIMAAVKQKSSLRHDNALEVYRAFMNSSKANEQLKKDIFANNSAIVKKQADGVPVYYTEWNLCASFSAPCNDTRMAAAYDLRTALAVEDNVAGSSIWCFTDLFEELHPFPEEFHGGFGIVTQSGIPKAVFHMLKMLNDAGEERFVLPGALDESVGAAAFKSDKGVQIIMTRLELMPSDKAEKESVQVSVEFDEKPARVALRRIDEEHGNPLKIWQELGSPAVPNPRQIEEIKRRSAVCPEEVGYSYENGVLSLSVELGENDVYFIEIEK